MANNKTINTHVAATNDLSPLKRRESASVYAAAGCCGASNTYSVTIGIFHCKCLL
jgi:hypothetical protein